MAVNYGRLWDLLSHRGLCAANMRQATGIAPNTLTRLRKNENVSLTVLDKICSFLNCDYGEIMQYVPDGGDGEGLSTFGIQSRRYLGSKYKLLPLITRVVNNCCDGVSSVADVFSGTGAVASAFSDRQIITNDLMYSNFICNYAWFGSQDYDRRKIREIIAGYNALNVTERNYMTENFSDTYFSAADCSKIGHIREDIETRYAEGTINQRERALLMMSLLYAMDKIANTCGHYDAYIQGAAFDRHLSLSVPAANTPNHPLNQCYNEDANQLVPRIHADLIYLDPPYNSRQYCDTYHLLENVARWEKPDVYGVAKKMNRDAIKSRYCTHSAEAAFRELIAGIHAKYILFSYNNMSHKGNERSNAKISDEAIYEALGRRGQVEVFQERHKAFSAGKSDIQDNAERLFLCRVKDN